MDEEFPERFSSLSKHDKELLFETLLFCIRANSGIGLKGGDQGHPVYNHGAESGNNLGWEYADSPEGNGFYQMYKELSLHMVDADSVSGMKRYFAVSWQEFCRLLVKYDKLRDGKPLLPPAYDES